MKRLPARRLKGMEADPTIKESTVCVSPVSNCFMMICMTCPCGPQTDVPSRQFDSRGSVENFLPLELFFACDSERPFTVAVNSTNRWSCAWYTYMYPNSRMSAGHRDANGQQKVRPRRLFLLSLLLFKLMLSTWRNRTSSFQPENPEPTTYIVSTSNEPVDCYLSEPLARLIC